MRKTLALLLLVGLLATSAALSRPVSAQSCGETYVVQKGDTLGSIAEKCDISYVVLININYEIEDPDLIRPGQTIRLTAEIPIYTTPASGPGSNLGLQEGGQYYIVRRGDSLARIAYLYNTTVYDLLQANPQLNNSTAIVPGQYIQLPYDKRPNKGWVGVSTLTASSYDEIEVRVDDFPPYANLQFRLHQDWGEEYEDLEDYFGDFYDDDLYSVITEGRTDALGKAMTIMKIPYWAYEEEIWVVDVYVLDEGEDAEPVTSPDITIID